VVLALEIDKIGFDKKNDCTSSVGKNSSENTLNLDIMMLNVRRQRLKSFCWLIGRILIQLKSNPPRSSEGDRDGDVQVL
jgi:hypothetical protein